MIHQYVPTLCHSKEAALTDLIFQSPWWTRATRCVDSHYSNTSGIMLADHLSAVTANLERLFRAPHTPFLAELFAFVKSMGLDKDQVELELRIVSLLHDIGKTEDDKSKMVAHPLYGYPTIKRHSIVGVHAALEILRPTPLLSDEEKAIIYSVIEEHDVSYGLFREYQPAGSLPPYEIWRHLNDRIRPREGVGLLYLLLFKLADIHGHGNVEDVIWFFTAVKATYFGRLGLSLPVPEESDIR